MKILTKVFLFSFVASAALAANTSKVDLKELQKQIASLQAQVNELKASSSNNNNAKVQKQIDELQDRIDENELNAALSKVKIGLDFTVGGASVHGKMNGVKSNNENKWATEVHLNLNAQINDRTRFTGRLAMAKYWGNIGNNTFIEDYEGGRNPHGNSVVYLDRAYIDYDIIPDVLVATIGRQPGTDGPGSNLRNNSVRMSTYPAMLVNAMGDALVLTYKPQSLKDYNAAFRAGYVRSYQGSEIDTKGGRNLLGAQKGKDSNLYLLMAEGELPLGDFGKNLLILSYIHGDKYSAHIDINVPNRRLKILDDTYNLGNNDLFNLHFESSNTFGSPFSWFVSASYYRGSKGIDNSEKMKADIASNLNIITTTGQTLEKVIPGSQAAAQATIAGIQNQIIQSGAVNWNNKDAWAIHIGARYDFTKAFNLGFEFFHGSKYWFALSRPGINDPLDFRNTRGNVYDIYAIWRLDLNQYLRFAYTHIDYHYANSSIPMGGTYRVNDKANVFSLFYNVRF
ncbi:MAG: DUF3373 family protein [Campylobacter sp.]|uniref:DUF3373 family protein n=1 Tax=Campylobacter sp. TaxID=205 RepID=UPI002AA63C5C|nr:DUF3373 family protein [Campylobacter sp.]MCI7550025.1 DUF3373 family protein [Campylobacter sp.]